MGNWLWTRISAAPSPLSSILLGVPIHPGDPVWAVDGLLLLICHGRAGDVQYWMGVDHRHWLKIMEAHLTKDYILLLWIKRLCCVPSSVTSWWSWVGHCSLGSSSDSHVTSILTLVVLPSVTVIFSSSSTSSSGTILLSPSSSIVLECPNTYYSQKFKNFLTIFQVSIYILP